MGVFFWTRQRTFVKRGFPCSCRGRAKHTYMYAWVQCVCEVVGLNPPLFFACAQRGSTTDWCGPGWHVGVARGGGRPG